MAELTKQAILGMVRRDPTYGYLLHGRLLERWPSYGDVAPPNQRTVYKILKVLEDEGLVLGRNLPESGRIRRRFDVTQAGRESYERWLTSEPESFAELVLRLATATEADLPVLLQRVVSAQHALLEAHGALRATEVETLIGRGAPWPSIVHALLQMVEYNQVAARGQVLQKLRRALEDVASAPRSRASG